MLILKQLARQPAIKKKDDVCDCSTFPVSDYWMDLLTSQVVQYPKESIITFTNVLIRITNMSHDSLYMYLTSSQSRRTHFWLVLVLLREERMKVVEAGRK